MGSSREMGSKPWKIISRPLLETILNNHAHHHRVPQPLILHGPRGVGKTTLILDRLLDDWNKGPHVTGYVDFAQSIKDHHPLHNSSFPWGSWSTCDHPTLTYCKTQLENCLESMAEKGIQLGTITSTQIFNTLTKWHRLDTALRRIILQNNSNATTWPRNAITAKVSTSVLWDRAIFALSARLNAKEIDEILGFEKKGMSLSMEEASYMREAIVALRLAKEVVKLQHQWRANAIAYLNRTGGFSRSLANSCTDWPCLLLELLSQAAETDLFQPKLVLNNIEVLKSSTLIDNSLVSASIYHDNLLWRIVALGANERCLPVILVTSDSYYSYQAFADFGYPNIFISRENFGWTPEEAKMHMVDNYFDYSEVRNFCSASLSKLLLTMKVCLSMSNLQWKVVVEVLGSNPRHLFELYALKQGNYYQKMLEDKSNTFEDIVDAYLAYLQINVVNPAMDNALSQLQKFADDARNGKFPKERFHFGSPWRHPPKTEDFNLNHNWAKLQLMDFVQSFVNTEFGVNYLADVSLEIMEDPCVLALIEVGLLYVQRDPSFIRPLSRGIERCLVRWLVQERMHMSFHKKLQFLWHRIIRGRSYRHLMQQEGYNK
ncbi:hypothetical protein K2173_011133 [Erythroxylum novogranatense]|uniref:Uncharacterized protein n=1 Tax=Erythroxylum novogranatense TaxID=1862640 RepID=A0AAV8U9N5_9ROSI|nr:hypothetical protein K2173_011133 [Erythroxylum novogranatense]